MTRPALAQRLGVVVPADLADELREHFEAATATTIDTMSATGEIPDDHPRWLAELALPRSVADVLTVAVADARARGLHDHATALVLTYLESMPRARLVQFLYDRDPHRWLFHAPVPWHELPRFCRGLTRLFDLFGAHGLDPRPLGAPDVETFLARRATLADFYARTYYGRLQPMFGATEHDLRSLAAEVATRPERRWDIVDRRLGHAMLHELLHFAPDREAIFPPYLDEAIAAHLQLLVDEAVAFPAPGDDTALIGWPWFSQVGAALARVVGDGPLLAAQAGLVPWTDIVPEPVLAELERAAWAAYQAAPAVHFHPDTTRPDRWVHFLYDRIPPAPDPARDHQMLVHALTATTVHNEQIDGCWRVTRRAPDGPVTIDFAAGVVRAPPRRSGWEPAPMIHVLPPSLIGPREPLVVTLADASDAAILAAARRASA